MVIEPSVRTLSRLGRLIGDGTESVPDADLVRRYVNTRDGAAFAALVRRHGSMVFGVCRRTLGHRHDAEDAFQATFLILARKAHGVRPDEVSRWLYGVAVRVANKARVQRVRRAAVPAELNDLVAAPVAAAPDWLPLLVAALSRLPDRYRWPVLLCDLQGRSRAEAAAELGIAEGTLSSRLARARAKLRSKLIYRGVAPTVAIAAALQAEPVPAALIESTLAVGASAAARQLAEGVVRSMFLTKFMTVASTACVLGAVTLAVVAVPGVGADPTTPSKSAAKEKEPPPKAKEDPKPKANSLPDAQRILGTWVIAEVLRHSEADAKKLIGQTITFESGRLTTSLFPGRNKTYRMDPGWDPKRLDFILRDGLGGEPSLIEALSDVPKEINVPAIYRFDGDRLHLGVGSSSRKVRPESFDLTAREMVFTHVVLHRGPDTARDDPTRDERKKLEGTWELIAVEGAGIRQSSTGPKLVFQGNRLSFHSTAKKSSTEVEYTIDPTPSPRLIDMTVTTDGDSYRKGQTLKGLYTVDGDLLTLTVSQPGEDRPKSLTDTNRFTMYYQREGTNPKLPPSGVTPRLRELQQERVNSLKVIAEELKQALMLGKGNVLEAVRADEDLAAAELELATTADARIKVLERLVQQLKQHEMNAVYHVTGGTLANTDQARVKLARIKAEIELEKLKAGK